MYHVAPPVVSAQDVGQRHRKMTSTGGNRSWSEEEVCTNPENQGFLA